MLFSEEVTAQSVQDKFTAEDITHYSLDGNAVVGVALQPGGRIAFLALRDPIGPFVPRTITIQDVADLRGQSMGAQTSPIEITVDDVARRRVRPRAARRGLAGSVRERAAVLPCPAAVGEIHWVGISSKSADADGKYSWDYVLRSAVASSRSTPRPTSSAICGSTSQRNGQRLNVDIVLLGRGTLQGRTLGEAARRSKDTAIRITSLTDQSEYGATTTPTAASPSHACRSATSSSRR